ncbi:MAG: hypothetical protein MJZ77_00265 [Bacteroidales bacterium]|nr:hypothetical protein [Bacteroidales bacterium]
MKDRLRQFIDYIGVNNYTFEKNIGTSEGTLRRFFGNKNGLTVATLLKIADIYPQINLDWLITGRGEMIFSQPSSASPQNASSDALALIADLARENGQLQAENNELKKELARAETKMAASAKNAAG